MAVLQKMRTKFGVAISIIVGLGLLSFIIDPSQITSAINSMSSKYDVGKIAGKKISYADFQQDIDRFTTINEVVTGSSVQGENQQQQIRDAAWQELINKYLVVKNAKAAGLRIGDAEKNDIVFGENVSPIIAQYFADENGAFSVENLKAFVQQLDADQSGQLRTFWTYLQNSVYYQEFSAKYGSLFNSANFANALQVEDAKAAGNATANIDYVVANYPMSAPDSTIQISANEVKDYYNSHKDFFKQVNGRDIEYVVFEVIPSDADIAVTEKAINDVYEEFSTTENMKSFLLKNSERSLSEYWYKAGELNTINAELNDAIFGGSDVTPVVRSGNEFLAARVVASENLPDSVYVKHILLQGNDAKNVADSLLNVVKADKGASFSALAVANSVDQNSAADGEIGNIGWMTQTYMIPGLESVITANVGEPYIVNSQYGTHVVLVTKKTAPVAKKQIAVLSKTALASKETFNEYYSKANTFATIANGTYEGYKQALDSTKVYSHPMSITEATANYGSIDNAKEVTRWAFDNKKGKASNIITVNQNFFFVVANKEVRKEGYAPVAQVSQSISNKLYNDKLKEKTLADVKAKIAGKNDLEAIASALGTTVESREGVSFSTFGAAILEPALIGAAAIAPEGQITGPVAGQMGVYVFKVSDKQTGEFYTDDDAKMTASQKAQYASQFLVPVMMENAGVVDNRARFF